METFDASIAALAASKPVPAGEGGGAALEGRAWFQGLMRCGRCGRLMQVSYHHDAPACVCGRAQQMYGAKTCQRIAGRRLEEPVLQALFAALAPAALAATIQALKDSEARHRQDLAVFERAVERARFEADRTRRQYDSVEPENRLAADPGGRPGSQAHRRADSRQPARRPAGPPPGHPDRAGSRLDHRGRRGPAGGVRRADHQQRAAQATVPRRHHRDRRHRQPGRQRRGTDCRPADHLARRREHRTDRAAGQDRSAQPRHQRGNPGPGAPARRALQRHHHRPDPRAARPAHRHRADPGQDPHQPAPRLP